jgi:hypothetical protein
MSDYQYPELKIDETFRKLIPPLAIDEYKQLEENLISEGCREPICIWNGVILDGHNRYEICVKHRIPFKLQSVVLHDRNEAIAWICANQLGRRNISEETRKYLIGKRFEAEKKVLVRNAAGVNQHTGEKVSPEMLGEPQTERPHNPTAERLGKEYHISHSTVEKYGRFSRSLDALANKDPSLVPKILSGKVKISHENAAVLAGYPSSEVRRISSQLSDWDVSYIGYSKTRQEVQNGIRVPKQEVVKTISSGSVKNMPKYDPDAELSSLTLTIPSWISTIERTWHIADRDNASAEAKEQLIEQLQQLKKTADLFILGIQGAEL